MMDNTKITIYCEFCDEKIVQHINYIEMILNRRKNGIGVECDDCLTMRMKKEHDLWDKEEFPKLVKTQHKLLVDTEKIIDKYLENGAHFMPIEYDAYDLDTDVKNAQGTIRFIRQRIENVFPKLLEVKE